MTHLHSNGAKKPRVVVAMSGGIDSSVAACLLADQGYEVVGMTMRLFDYAPGVEVKNTACCSLDMVEDARRVCDGIGAAHYTIDLRKPFSGAVQQNFIHEYLAGRTPNPCVQCNIYVKWQSLWQKSREIGADWFATGHYAQVVDSARHGRKVLTPGVDAAKDQSYALWGIRNAHLQHTLLPVGGMEKSAVRAYAEARGLHNAGKPDSQDICFIPDGDYSRFLNDERPDLSATVEGGEIRNLEGVTLGQHRGYPHYTVGQRKGLGLATGQPQYVVHIEPDTNTLIVGDEADLYHDTCILQQVNLLAIDRLETPMEVRVKIRYHDEGAPATIEPTETDRIRVRFHQPRRAITPGQSAVFYDNDVMVGGGVIVRDGLGPQDRWHI